MKGNTIKGKTQSGFSFSVDVRRLRDIRFLELMADNEESNNQALILPKLVGFALGAEQKQKLYTHLEKDGFVDAAEVEKEMIEIFDLCKEASGEVKNS